MSTYEDASMSAESFEKMSGIFSRLGFQYKDRAETPKGDVYVGEKYFDRHPEMDRPHICTLYVIERREGAVARPCRHALMTGMLSEKERIRQAFNDGKDFLGANRS